MIDETPREASYAISRAAIKLTAAAVVFTLVIAGYPPQPAAHAAISGQSVQEASPQSDRPVTQSDQGPHQAPNAQAKQDMPAGPAMTLSEVERIATQNNPTLAQAEAAIRAAQGRKLQAGLFPNPTVGYQGDEFAFRAFSDKSEHFFFVEQTIPLGGKLSKSQRIFEKEVSQAETEATAQKQRVLNTVRMLYYEALGAQQRVDLRTELARIAHEAVKTTSELQNVGQADRPDYLESEIEAQQVELELVSAENDRDQVWQLLASVVGMPEMKPARLAGDLDTGIPALDQETLMTTLTESPEIKSARAEVERAQAVIARAKAERVPDLFLRGGVGYSNEILETRTGPTGRKTGPEANVQVGFTLPIFNRNQGGIAAAEAELVIAKRETKRLELALGVRLAQAFRDYKNALISVQRYKETILPRAERAYNLYLASFRQMAASYPQVLISQRTMFQVRENYLNAMVEVRQNAIRLEGFLLTGGLDAPRVRSSESGPERVEMTGVRSGSQGVMRDMRDR
jgi:cobalt-zinc-cadmium efflux system outer membrane protein